MWKRLSILVQEQGVRLGIVVLVGGNIRAHEVAAVAAQKGGSGAGRDTLEAPGRSRGGYGTKACAIADGGCRAIAFSLAPGPAHELPMARALISRLQETPTCIVADRGYSSHALFEHIWSRSSRPPAARGATRLPFVDIPQPQSGGAARRMAQRMARGRHLLREGRCAVPRRPLPRRLAQPPVGD